MSPGWSVLLSVKCLLCPYAAYFLSTVLKHEEVLNDTFFEATSGTVLRHKCNVWNWIDATITHIFICFNNKRKIHVQQVHSGNSQSNLTACYFETAKGTISRTKCLTTCVFFFFQKWNAGSNILKTGTTQNITKKVQHCWY